MKRWHKLFAVLAVCLFSFGSIGLLGMQHIGKAAYAADTFTPIVLDPTGLNYYDDFYPYGISDNGIIGGEFYERGIRQGAGTWQSGSFTAFSEPAGADTIAQGMSPTGEVVGLLYGNPSHAVKWSSTGAATDLGGPTSGSCDPATDTTLADAANDIGDVAGYCYNNSGVFHAGYWPGGAANSFTKLPDIGNSFGYSYATGINHSGNIVGFSGFYDPNSSLSVATHAVLWRNGAAQDISPADATSSSVAAINDNNLAAGYASFNTDSYDHGYVWDLDHNQQYDLYVLTGHSTVPYAINNAGVVVGTYHVPGADGTNNSEHAFMWRAGDGFVDLNDLLASGSGWVLNSADGINSSGQIVGQGYLNGALRHFLLNTSTPSSYQLSLAPASQTATIGGRQGLVTATLLDGATSAPVPNVKLSSRVEAGPNAGISGTCSPNSCTTDASGQVGWVYLGTAIGIDTVQVWMDTNGNGVPDTGEAQTTATVSWIQPSTQAYVALGDSYSSGEGAPNPNFLPGTDDHTIPNLCHRSTAAYPWLTHSATRNTYPTFVFRACSGAIIKDFSSANQHNKGEPAQLSWLNSYTGLVTLTIGGNDVGFADVMEYCATRQQDMPSCKSVYNDRVNALIKQIGSTKTTASSTLTTLLSLYAAIGKAAPNAKVLVVGYPRLFPAKNLPLLCSTGVFLPVPTFFMPSDMKWLNEEAKNLDNAIKTAVDNANKVDHSHRFDYVSTYDAFNGHELCTSHPYVNRAIIDTSYDPIKLTQWSFHPNVSGQAALAAIVESYAT